MTSTARWIALALLGIAIAAGVSIAASRLASQQIGLASQPISAGDALVPQPSNSQKNPKTPPPKTSTTPSPPTTIPASPTTPVVPNPSGGGEGDGGGGGGGSDD